MHEVCHMRELSVSLMCDTLLDILWMGHVTYWWVTSYICRIWCATLCWTSCEEACHIWWVTSHVCRIECVTLCWTSCERVMSHMDESRHIYAESDARHFARHLVNESSYIWMSHVTHMQKSCHIWMSRVIFGCVVSRKRMDHIKCANLLWTRRIWCIILCWIFFWWVISRRYDWVMSHTWRNHATHMNESCHTYKWATSHIQMSHVTHMNESCHAYEWVTSHIWMRHVPHMNVACHTHEWVTHMTEFTT